MINYQNGSETAVYVLHEIYGLNQHIRDFCQDLAHAGFDVIAPDLLGNGQIFCEEQEEAAYQYFINKIGFETAVGQVKALARNARNRYRKIILIGFSVGATVAWLCCREAGLCDAVVGFYGSRIRDYLEMEPESLVLLFFPEKENKFEVNQVVEFLNKMKRVSAKQLQGEHGFANPLSDRYNKQSTQQAWEETLIFIRNISPIE